MKHKKINLIIKIILITLLIILFFGATKVSAAGLDDIFSTGKNFIDKGSENSPISVQDAIDKFIPVGTTLVGIATIVLVVVGLIMGVKYMISGANEKAQLKQKLIYYVISVVLVYGATGIFAIVISVLNNILD